ncbi:MAG: DegT/DnrJ/EryC1/StrS family aminotransferase [Actinomycetaceae bacterium]|nr:DegT/DnrJ/EryC1/StrS family aminotransferase [Actinomycetaceae bacterium]
MNKYYQSSADVKKTLGAITGTSPEDWFLVFRARAGMEIVFGALRDVRGSGQVVTQAYTCATAVNPIISAGLIPRYADISPTSIAIDPELVEVPSDLRALVAQHTFGIIDEEATAALSRIAHDAGAILVEDSAHCVARMAKHRVTGEPLADVSVHSFGVEKMLRTKFGGAIWLNPDMEDKRVRQAIAERLRNLTPPNMLVKMAAPAYLNEIRVFNRLPGRIAGPLKTIAERAGVFLPPIAQRELVGQMDRSPLKPSQWTLEQMLSGLQHLSEIEQTRREAGAIYARELEGLIDIPARITKQSALVRFPIYLTQDQLALGRDPEDLFDALTVAGFYPGRWYRPALFPGVKNASVYHFDPGLKDLPQTKRLIASAVNLPTLQNEEKTLGVCDVVRAWLDS